MPRPRLGESPVVIGLPSRPISLALLELLSRSIRLPAAALTPGSDRTSASTLSGTVGLPLEAPSTSGRPLITTSVSA